MAGGELGGDKANLAPQHAMIVVVVGALILEVAQEYRDKILVADPQGHNALVRRADRIFALKERQLVGKVS